MTHLARHLVGAAPALGLAAALLVPSVAHAQAAVEPAISERVKKDAASPLYWIRLNAQKADNAPAKPAPRISEVRPAPRPAPAVPAGGGGNPVATAVAGTSPASTGPAPGGSAETTAVLSAPAPLAPPSPATVGTAAVAGTAAAGLVAPAASAATHAAQAAQAAHEAMAPPPDEEPDELEEPLELALAAEPEFPALVMRRLRKGTVQVRFEVQPDGSVSNASVVQTSHRSLNDTALEAVAGWRFKPVRSPRHAVVELGFDLDG